jgi:hypothetical protein
VVGLRDHHAPYSFGPVRPLTQLFPDPGQPLVQPCGFDLCESHPVHPRHAEVGFRQPIGVPQNVRSPDLVVEQVEAEVRFRLRLEIELLLKVYDGIPAGVGRVLTDSSFHHFVDIISLAIRWVGAERLLDLLFPHKVKQFSRE